MLKDIEAVIFDLDGTLVDSMWMWPDIDTQYLARFGLNVPENLHDCIGGMSFSETAAYFKNEFQLSCTVDEIKSDWMQMAYDKYEKEVKLKPGAFGFIRELKKRNIPIGIATSNARMLVDVVLNSHQLTGYIDSIHTSCEVKKGKPSPDIYLLVSRELNVDPKHCLVFEDITMGILAGKNAGMKVCAVEDNYSSYEREKKKKLADYYIESYDSILENTYEVCSHE